MNGRLVVKRYVRALMETADEKGKTAIVESDMQTLDRILNEAPSIRQFCLKPDSKRSTELEFVKTAFVPYLGEYTGRTIVAAVENGRLACIPFFPAAFRLRLEELGDGAVVLVESAQDMETKVLDQIKLKMAERTGKKISLKTKIIPEILGGFRIIWQNKIIDMSALGRLKKIRQLIN